MIKIRYKFLEYEQNNFHRVKSVQIRIFFWSVFSRIRTAYRYLQKIFDFWFAGLLCLKKNSIIFKILIGGIKLAYYW